jgi:hypothetical protein
VATVAAEVGGVRHGPGRRVHRARRERSWGEPRSRDARTL